MTFFVLVQSLTTFAFAKEAFLQSGAISGDVYSFDDLYSYSLSTTLGNNYYDPITVVTGAVTQPRGGIEGAGACYIVQYTFPKVKIPVYSGGFEYPSPSLSKHPSASVSQPCVAYCLRSRNSKIADAPLDRIPHSVPVHEY